MNDTTSEVRRVLVVDDDFDIRTMLGMTLELEGYAVELAAHGRDALERLRVDPHAQLILLDLRMPVMNGWQFREAQRANPAIADIPVVVLSGDGDVEAETRAVGASSFLKKPVDLDELIRRVSAYA